MHANVSGTVSLERGERSYAGGERMKRERRRETSCERHALLSKTSWGSKVVPVYKFFNAQREDSGLAVMRIIYTNVHVPLSREIVLKSGKYVHEGHGSGGGGGRGGGGLTTHSEWWSWWW